MAMAEVGASSILGFLLSAGWAACPLQLSFPQAEEGGSRLQAQWALTGRGVQKDSSC